MFRVFGAMMTVLVTTLDDAVWLVPFVGTARAPTAVRCLHALLFVATLVSLSMASVGVAWVLSYGIRHHQKQEHHIEVPFQNCTTEVSSNTSHHLHHVYQNLTTISSDLSQQLQQQQQELRQRHESLLLGMLGATLCWLIALALFAKKQYKKLQRQKNANQNTNTSLQEEATPFQHQQGDNRAFMSSSSSKPVSSRYGTATSQHHAFEDDDNGHFHDAIMTASPWTVISLTALGALDEISYFPALVVGGVFTAWELCIGTLLAALTMLAIVTFFLQPFQPIINCFDRIPLYGIVAAFATALTFNTWWEWSEQ